MKFNFPFKDDGKRHQYCVNCHAETVERVYKDGRTYHLCSTCGETNERALVINPAIKWHVAPDGEMHHESTGVFIRSSDGRFLFFERVAFPFALTVPAGHLDVGEDPRTAAAREIQEEVGFSIDAKELLEIATEEIHGDSCWQGCDIHTWHAFLAVLHTDVPVETVNDEGRTPVWLTLEEAKAKELTFPVTYIIDTFQDDLERTS